MRVYLILLTLFVGHVSFAKVPERKLPQKTVAELKQDLEIERDPQERFYRVSQISDRYSSQDLPPDVREEAKSYAEMALSMSADFKKNWDYGNAVHHAHLVLGRLHLLDGRMEEAKKELKLAGDNPGSPQLNTFGPNMTLAKELLEKGEKAAVLTYFDQCQKFWKKQFSEPEISNWKADIASGKIPDFGANLVY